MLVILAGCVESGDARGDRRGTPDPSTPDRLPVVPGTTDTDANGSDTSTTSAPLGYEVEETPPDCNPDAIVGATWVPPDSIPCPVAPDATALAACTGETVALAGGKPYGDVQAAIDATEAGGVVTLCPGTFTAGWDMADISVVAADPTAGATVLNGVEPGHSSRNIQVNSRGTSLLRGLTLEGWSDVTVVSGTLQVECMTATPGASRGGHALRTGRIDNLTVRHSTFYSNAIQGSGPVLVEDSLFDGGGTTVHLLRGSSLELRRTTFRNMYVPRSDYPDAGAVDSKTDRTYIEDSWFEENSSHYVGAVRAWEELVLRNVTFARNHALAANASAVSATILDMERCTLVGNTTSTRSQEWGTTLSLKHASRLASSRIEGNTSEGWTSAFQINGSSRLSGDTTATDLVVRSNVGVESALRKDSDDAFTCICCDFGRDEHDNAPADAHSNGVTIDALPLSFTLR